MEVLKFLPQELSKMILENIEDDFSKLEEIRLRANKPVILKLSDREIVLDYIISQEELLMILQFICDNSIYSYQNQICKRIYYYKRRAQSSEYLGKRFWKMKR